MAWNWEAGWQWVLLEVVAIARALAFVTERSKRGSSKGEFSSDRGRALPNRGGAP